MPEGDLLALVALGVALDGSNDSLEGSLSCVNENVEEGGNKLEHNVLLTTGKRRTRGLFGAPKNLHDLREGTYFYRTKDPLLGVSKRSHLHFKRNSDDHALSMFGSTDKQARR